MHAPADPLCRWRRIRDLLGHAPALPTTPLLQAHLHASQPVDTIALPARTSATQCPSHRSFGRRARRSRTAKSAATRSRAHHRARAAGKSLRPTSARVALLLGQLRLDRRASCAPPGSPTVAGVAHARHPLKPAPERRSSSTLFANDRFYGRRRHRYVAAQRPARRGPTASAHRARASSQPRWPQHRRCRPAEIAARQCEALPLSNRYCDDARARCYYAGDHQAAHNLVCWDLPSRLTAGRRQQQHSARAAPALARRVRWSRSPKAARPRRSRALGDASLQPDVFRLRQAATHPPSRATSRSSCRATTPAVEARKPIRLRRIRADRPRHALFRRRRRRHVRRGSGLGAYQTLAFSLAYSGNTNAAPFPVDLRRNAPSLSGPKRAGSGP